MKSYHASATENCVQDMCNQQIDRYHFFEYAENVISHLAKHKNQSTNSDLMRFVYNIACIFSLRIVLLGARR